MTDQQDLPPDVVAAIERAQSGLDEATSWLAANGRELGAESAESVVAWTDRILRMVGREPQPERRSKEEIRVEARQAQLELGPTTIPQAGRGTPTIEVDRGADRVRLVFEMSLAQFWALEAVGRVDYVRRNVQDLHLPFGVPWEDERCVRHAISRALGLAYPEVLDVSNIREEALARAGASDEQEATER